MIDEILKTRKVVDGLPDRTILDESVVYNIGLVGGFIRYDWVEKGRWLYSLVDIKLLYK